MQLNHVYSTEVMFETRLGKIVKKRIEYELKPLMHSKYKIFGHEVNAKGIREMMLSWKG